jgi:DNA invertase Pin-like site-specific DNA recombinase
MSTPHAIIYARYSRDRQREASIDDQVRNCTRFAEREGLAVADVFSDKAISGAVLARPGYQAMLEAAMAGRVGVLIVDDLSRLSRDDYEMKGVIRRLTWRGVRIIGVSDGYDSERKGHKIHAGFKGLMNELFLDDIRERTHRGMTGQALKGFNCGGRTYGYRNVPIEDETKNDAYGRPAVVAVRYEIDETQAEIVRRIHGWYAEGYSYKWIACELNRNGIRSSRGTTWAVSAIKVILENEMYGGTLIWNRRVWVKHPDTGKRTCRERPELRIVSESVLDAVRARQRRNCASGLGGQRASAARKYILSGMMHCASCDGNFVIASGGRYGCASHWTRGPNACSNGMTVSRRIIESCILDEVKARLRNPQSLERFKRSATQLIEAHNASDNTAQIEQQLKAAGRTRDNILDAIKRGIITESTKAALENAEAEVKELKQQLKRTEGAKVSAILPRAVERFEVAVRELEHTLDGHVEPAREVLRSILGARIPIHHRGEYLEAELPDCAQAIVARSLNSRNDSSGCGGRICLESTFVPLRHTGSGARGQRRHRRRESNPTAHNSSAKR